MAHRASPAFQFYARDYLADLHVQAMTFEERGMYWHLCCLYWLEDGLPDEPGYLAKVLKLSRRKFDRVWKYISPCFEIYDGRLHHKRLEEERANQAIWRNKCALGGRISAARRAPDQGKGSCPVVEPPGNYSSTLHSASAEEQEQKNIGLRPISSCGKPVDDEPPKLSLVLRLGYDVLSREPYTSDADLSAGIKARAGELGIACDNPTVAKAVAILTRPRTPLEAPIRAPRPIGYAATGRR